MPGHLFIAAKPMAQPAGDPYLGQGRFVGVVHFYFLVAFDVLMQQQVQILKVLQFHLHGVCVCVRGRVVVIMICRPTLPPALVCLFSLCDSTTMLANITGLDRLPGH